MQGERRGARPARAARRRRVDPDPDDARQERPRRALRPAPLDRAPARRGGAAALPGREDRDRPADRERLLLRLRVPRADPRVRSREDRGRDAAASSRKGAPGRARRSPARKRRKRFEAEGEPYKVELVDTAEGDITLYTQGDFTDLCRGPAPAGLEADQGGQAHRARRRVLARRRAEHAADPDLRDRVLRPGRPRRAPRRARGGAGARPPAARAAARPLPPLRPLARLAVLAPEGDGDLELARGPPPPREPEARLRRGEDAAPLRHPDLHHLGPLRELPREHVLRPRARRGRVRAQADELPGAHAPLRQPAALATASCRSASPSRRRCTATSSAARSTASCA